MDRKWLALVAVATGVFMLLIDVTIVNVALPDIATDLHSSFSNLEWVVNAYTLTLASTLLVFGSVADLIGRRRVFLTGLVLFSAASLGCGLSGTPLLLNLMRGVQGVGGGMMFATSLAIIAQTFHGPERGVAFGIMGAVTGAAVAIGPLLGGVLTDVFGWQAIFLVNLPIGAFAVYLTLTKVTESKDPHPSGIDWLGAILFAGALFLLIFGLVDANKEGWGSAQILGCLIGSVVLLGAFVAVELRRENPLFDLHLLRKPSFLGASLVAFCMSASLFAIFLYLTLYLQGGVLGYSPLEAGLRFLPITALMLVVGPIAGRLTTKVPVRLLLGGGLFLVGLGLALMHGVDPGDDWTVLIVGFVIAGVGSGFVNPPLASTAIGVVEQRRSGMASGINSTFRQVGIAGGVAALGAVFQHRVGSVLHAQLDGVEGGAARADDLAAAVTAGQTEAAVQGAADRGATPELVDTLRNLSHEAFVSGMNTLLVITAIVAFVGAAGALVLIRKQDFVASGPGAPGPGAPGSGASGPGAAAD
ncbi:MFS transporter [Patulibacter sp. NPDC049589]|uniref:MFS transporter n=1 Tax=Patulibacter sp. NPDC049589 TaxID=3154731 RepID=UPI0034389AF1